MGPRAVNSAQPGEGPEPSLVAAGVRALLNAADAGIAGAGDRLFPWAPVGFGAGIATFFQWSVEPSPWPAALLALAAVLAAVWARFVWVRPSGVAVFLGVALVSGGFAHAALRTARVAAPVLAAETYAGPLEGRVVGIDQARGAARVVLAEPHWPGLSPGEAPARVRVRLLPGDAPVIGTRIAVPARLSPPPPPVVPGGYDFGRQAFFQRIGGVGFAVGRLSVTDRAAKGGLAGIIENTRQAIRQRVLDGLAGEPGADRAAAGVVVALLVGLRGDIPAATAAEVRDSGLAHLLAISGLHVGLVAGAVMAGLRLLLAAVPGLALRWPTKKWAAVIALAVAAAYTLLAGATPPTQRSFVMLAVAIAAVLADRFAVTMRLVAVAALVVLLLAPEAIVGVSFQMSFAAVVALVAGFEWWATRRDRFGDGSGHARRSLRWVAGVAATTLIASLATAPIAAHQFNQFQLWSVAANLVAVPLAAFVVMPLGLLAVCLMPFGLEGLPLAGMALGVDAILAVASTVAGWPYAALRVPSLAAWGFGLVVAGGLWLALTAGRPRLLGVPLIAVGLASALLVRPPDLLVSPDGRVAARDAEGNWRISGRASDWTGDSWRRHLAARGAAAWPRAGEGDAALRCDAVGCRIDGPNGAIAFVRQYEALVEDCGRARVVVALVPVRGRARRLCRPPEVVIDSVDLRRDGVHAVRLAQEGVRVTSVAAARGRRLWTPAGARSDAGGREDDQ